MSFNIVFDTNVMGLKSYMKNATDENTEIIDNIIKLYKGRKITNIKNALNCVINLTSKTGEALKVYQTVLNKYNKKVLPPLTQQPITVKDLDILEVKPQTNTNKCIFCIDSDTDSTRDESEYEYINEPYKHEKHVIKFSIDFDDEFVTLPALKPKEIKPKNVIIDTQPTAPPPEEPKEEPKEEPINDIIDEQQEEPIIFDPNEKLKELITIYEQPSILHDIELIEIPNIKNIEKLLKSDLLQLVKHKSGLYENERHHLESYKSLIDINNEVKVRYVKKDKYNFFGRSYCKAHMGAIALRREIRGTIFGDIYTDIDIVNCHPSLILQIAQMYEIECPQLTNYVTNRTKVLSEVMNYYKVNRDQAKNLFIILLYDGQFSLWSRIHKVRKQELPFIAQMKKEFNTISEKVISNNQHLRSIVKNKLIELNKYESERKVDKTTLAYYAHEIECRILDQVYLYCVDKGVIKHKVVSPAYDGLMILKENYYPELLDELEELIFYKFGLRFKFEQKSMISYSDILDDHIVTYNEIEIDSRYLLDEHKLLNDDTIIVKSIKTFFDNPEIKSLNIKSPYDTGKTQLLKQILTKYNPNRVLWVSYRLTLSYDVFSNFAPFNFKIYTDKDYDADRLIIQAESLLKLINDRTDIKKYDLIVIDEVESVLRQFSSTTFKGKAPITFDLFINLLKHPQTKMISLDGDLGDRTHDFTTHLGKSININNIARFNTKTINVMNVKEDFENKIFNDLDLNLKLVIPTMSATEGNAMCDKLRNKYPNKVILYYSGLTSDEDKLDITNILDKWSNADVVIYSPTIEAGVSFDRVHFDRLYGIMCNSCTVLAFFQMMARVRKFNNDDFYIFTKLKHKPRARLWTYDEVNQQTSYKQDSLLENEYIFDNDSNIIINRKNSLYRNIFIHNTLEKLNNNDSTILKLFYDIGTRKGFTINLDFKDKPKNEKTINIKHVDISNASDIDDTRYNELIMKQQQNKATKADKLEIEKHVIKNILGLDIIDEYIVKHYYKHEYILKNFTGLIDTENIRDKDEITKLERYEKIEIVKNIIKYMGFDSDNIFNNDKTLYKPDIFDNNINNTLKYIIDHKDNKNFNYLINHSKQDLNHLLNKDLSAKLRYINSVINSYGIIFKRHRQGSDTQFYKDTKKRKMLDYFKIEIKQDINEIISNKITYRNFKLKDNKNIYKVVKPDIFKKYITREPYNEYDTRNLDLFE